ncbi:MAG TPA: hypothetical protein VN627_10095 [Novosphingobium sp.]|nr:hypothetical protein [Novosphingobium sp.]
MPGTERCSWGWVFMVAFHEGLRRDLPVRLLAGSSRKASITLARELLGVVRELEESSAEKPVDQHPPCPSCGGHMIIIETFERWRQPRPPPTAATYDRELAP